ncbi:MAG: archease [Anaerolineae bacterium]|nr:archease [Anaerolineae bacterium]
MTAALRRFEEVEHVADAAVRAYGHDWPELLVNAALGMFSLLAHWDNSSTSAEREVSLHSMDRETLLVDWLSELLYLHEMDGVVFFDFEMAEVSANSLTAVIKGTPQWRPRTAIKAVTFNDLHVAETPQGYTATIVFDT